MYGSPLGPLMSAGYSSYMWHHLPGLFLPYPPFQKAMSPDKVISMDRGYASEKAKVGKYTSFFVEIVHTVVYIIPLTQVSEW